MADEEFAEGAERRLRVHALFRLPELDSVLPDVAKVELQTPLTVTEVYHDTDDLRLPRLAHVAYFRSPHAHARIRRLDFGTAQAMPGVIAVVDGHALARYCKPWVAVLGHLKGIQSPPQYPIAIDRACWQGEAVAAVVAETRAQAEDAAERIAAEWEPLPAVVEMEEALAGRRVIHPELGNNVCFRREQPVGWAKARSAVPTVLRSVVGTLRFSPPTRAAYHRREIGV